MKTIVDILKGAVSVILFFVFMFGVGILSDKIVPVKKKHEISCSQKG